MVYFLICWFLRTVSLQNREAMVKYPLKMAVRMKMIHILIHHEKGHFCSQPACGYPLPLQHLGEPTLFLSFLPHSTSNLRDGHSSNKHSVSGYPVLGTVLGAEDTVLF